MPRGRTVPNGIGTLIMRGDRSEYLGALPYDAAGTLPLIVLPGGYRFVYLSGPPTRHRSPRIQSCGFHRHYDPDDL